MEGRSRGVHGPVGRKPTSARPHLQVSTSKEMDQWVWGMEPSALNPEFTTLVLGGHLRPTSSV